MLVKPVLSEWIKRYEADADKAMLELIQFFVECCGCKASISMEQYQESTTSDAIRSLTENFAEARNRSTAQNTHSPSTCCVV